MSLVDTSSRAGAFYDVEVLIDAPVSMALETQFFEMAETQSVAGGRRIITWAWRDPVPTPVTRRD